MTFFLIDHQLFYILSNLHVIVSEFYDLDVGTVKRIEIKPERIQDSFYGTWSLNEVQGKLLNKSYKAVQLYAW